MTPAFKPSAIVLLVLILSLSGSPRARAEASFGDAAVTVAVGTVAGAVLGASTLPFYEDSGEHTKNIFYGAALGAVAGVFVSAYAGVQEGPAYDGARPKATPASALSLNEAPELKIRPESTSAVKRHATFAMGNTFLWSPVAQVRF